LVVGATYPQDIARVRELAPTLPLLIPGIGAQGGDPVSTVRAGLRQQGKQITGPIIVNSSRAILYASADSTFAQAARHAAMEARNTLALATEVIS
jgi:orotidine-5'-phosphate decarboxylase